MSDPRPSRAPALDEEPDHPRPDHLLIIEPGRPLRRVPLRLERLVLGRAPDCDVVLHDSSVSRRHAVLEPSATTPTRLCVRDLGSTNGILAEDRLVDRYELPIGTSVEIGGVRVRVCGREALDETKPATASSRRETRQLDLHDAWQHSCGLSVAREQLRVATERGEHRQRELGLAAYRAARFDCDGRIARALEQLGSSGPHDSGAAAELLDSEPDGTAPLHRDPTAPHRSSEAVCELAAAYFESGARLEQRLRSGEDRLPAGCEAPWRALRRARQRERRAERRLARVSRRSMSPPASWWARLLSLTRPIVVAGLLTSAALIRISNG